MKRVRDKIPGRMNEALILQSEERYMSAYLSIEVPLHAAVRRGVLNTIRRHLLEVG